MTDKEIIEQKKNDLYYDYESFFLSKYIEDADDVYYCNYPDENIKDVIVHGNLTYAGKTTFTPYFSSENEKINKTHSYIEQSVKKNI